MLSSHTDSNLGSIRTHFTNSVGIPPSQIYGIDETLLLGSSSEDVASSYEENVVKYLLNKSNKSTDDNDDDNGKIDCVL